MARRKARRWELRRDKRGRVGLRRVHEHVLERPRAEHDQEQLELAIATGESSPVVCSECGRWNYHLATCTRKESPIG